MKLWNWIFIVAMLAVAGSALASGTVVQTSFFSSSINATEPVNVYLPEGYPSGGPYPVIYFLHGIGNGVGVSGVPDNYAFTEQVIDFMSSMHLIHPTILVRPNGYCAPYGGSMWTNSEMYGAWDDYISNDVVPFIDSHYATAASREYRAIMGHSMGGLGAMTVAMNHTDLFSSVYSLSGFLSILPVDYFLGAVLMENGGTAPYNYSPTAGFFSGALFTAAGAFSPSMTPPYFVTLPLDENGQLSAPVVAHWVTHMPPYAARNNMGSQPLSISFDCGTSDEVGFYAMNLAFRDSLDAIGIPYHFESFDGNHSDHLGERFQHALMSLDQVLPVEFSGMTAVVEGNAVVLNWATASERDNARFEVLRDGSVIGSVDGAGTSAAAHQYSWRDAGVVNGMNYKYALVSVDLSGNRVQLAEQTVHYAPAAATIHEFALLQNYPNPFNPTTTVAFDLAASGTVSLKVFNTLGQETATLVNGTMSEGRHSVTFDAAGLPSGIYICRLNTNGFVAEKKMLLMK